MDSFLVSMDYFTARNAAKRISKFRDAYLRSLEAGVKNDAEAFDQSTIEMARISQAVRHDLKRIHSLAEFYLQNSSTARGPVLSIDIVSLAIQNQIAADFGTSTRQIRLPLESAIGEYQRVMHSEFWNLFNPFWWIGNIFAFVARLPLYVLGWAGFNRESLEESRAGQVYTRVARLAVIVVIVITVLINSQALVWFDNLSKVLSPLLGSSTP